MSIIVTLKIKTISEWEGEFMLKLKGITLAGVASLLILAACGGGSDSTPAAGGGAVTGAGTVSGTAGSGSPVVGGTVTITDSATPPNELTTTTNADGTYSVSNTDNLTFPVRITVSFAEGGAIRNLRSIAVSETSNDTTRANINPITDVIAGSVEGITDATALNTEITRLTGVLAAILANYGVPADTDFIGGNYTADPAVDSIDNALDMVNVQLDNAGNNILVQSTADPSINQMVAVAGTQPEDVTTPLPEPAPTASTDPSDIKALVDGLGAAFALGENLTSTDLNNVFHDDYQDDDGFTKAQYAELLAEEAATEGLELTVTGYKILRCFADSAPVTDKCYVRVTFTSPTLEGEDFQGTTGAKTVSDFTDLIAERRSGGALKFAGGFFKPFSATIKLFNANTVSVNSNGIATVSSTVSKGLSMNAAVAGPGQTSSEPNQLANMNLKTIQLVRDIDTPEENILMSVTRSLTGQCVGSNNRLNVSPSGNNCGNQAFDSIVSTAAADSAAGKLTAVFIRNDDTELNIPNIRIADPSSSALSSFGTLNQTSLENLTAYSMGSGAGTVSITLTPPAGASFVCISDGGNNEDICTFSSRSVTISSTQLNRQSTYFILTRDAENNTFQRIYRLNQNIL